MFATLCRSCYNSKMAVITTHSTADLDGVASTVAAVKLYSGGPNLIGTLKHRLPAPITRLLQEAGELADRMDLSAYVVGGFVRDLLWWMTPTTRVRALSMRWFGCSELRAMLMSSGGSL